MPYKILGSMRFYDRKEIKDMIAYLAVINSPGDALRLKRIINEPKRKIGAATVDALEEIAQLEGKTMYEVMQNAENYTALAKSAEKLVGFVSLIEGIKSANEKPSVLIERIFNETGYRSMLLAEGFEGEGKIANVDEFISAAVEYEKRCAGGSVEPTLVGFLEEISLVSDVDKYDESADAVVLMTIHAAKGLEFPVVFIAGTEDGIFPSQQNMFDPAEMSEERRLMYVAITRAKEKLYITHAKNRTMYGRTGYNPLSVFIREELPETLVFRDAPRKIPPRRPATFDRARQPQQPYMPRNSELHRPVEISGAQPKKSGAGNYGIEKFAIGTKVTHSVFGKGVIKSARDMGGDVLYEVDFESGVSKKLMATYAKLQLSQA